MLLTTKMMILLIKRMIMMAMLLITKMNTVMRNDVHLLLEREAAIEPHHLNLGLKLQIASIKICLCSNHPSVFQSSMCLFVKVSI